MLNLAVKETSRHEHTFNSKRWWLCYCLHRGLVWNWQLAVLWWYVFYY